MEWPEIIVYGVVYILFSYSEVVVLFIYGVVCMYELLYSFAIGGFALYTGLLF